MTGESGANKNNQKRKDLRPQIASNKSRNTGKPLGDTWLKNNWPQLLEAHYECVHPGALVCLQDALHMIATGKFCISSGERSKEEDTREPRTLSGSELHAIRIWYDEKDKQLTDAKGDTYVTERNLSAVARQYHEDNVTCHNKTHERLAEIQESLGSLRKEIRAGKGTPSRKGRGGAVPERPQRKRKRAQ